MLRRFVMAFFLGVYSFAAFAVAPYISADKVRPGKLKEVVEAVEAKLSGAGFQVLASYQPKGLSGHGVVVVTDEAMLAKVRELGGANIIAAPIRVGVAADGSVSYMNPDYWYRAYFRNRYPQAETAVRALQTRLAKALGAGRGFGGDEAADFLPKYQYMVGMERFDSSKNLLAVHDSFDDAVRTVRDNLAREKAEVSKVYEIVMPEKKIAVFGVGLNSLTTGDAVWISKIGVQERIAALPYEMFVVNDEVYALFGRYRLALALPDLSMGHFLRIVYAPEDIRHMLIAVANGPKKD